MYGQSVEFRGGPWDGQREKALWPSWPQLFRREMQTPNSAWECLYSLDNSQLHLCYQFLKYRKKGEK